MPSWARWIRTSLSLRVQLGHSRLVDRFGPRAERARQFVEGGVGAFPGTGAKKLVDDLFQRLIVPGLQPERSLPFGLKPLRPPGPEDLYDVINERYEKASVILTILWNHQPAPARPVARLPERCDPGGRDLRPAPAQRPPACAKRTLTAKGGEARQLTGPASLRSDHDPPIPRDHDRPI
jgi:hypothetical protein